MADPSALQISIDAFRARSTAREAHATNMLSAAYADVLTELQPRIAALDKKIAEARAAGEEPGISWLFQQDRYRELERQVRQQMAQYGQTTRAIATAAQQAATRDALTTAGTQLTGLTGDPGIARLAAGWAAIPEDAIVRMVGALQENTPLDQTIRSYEDAAAQDVRNALARGLALGDSADMTTRIITALGVTRARAAALVRTEMLRASRGASIAAYKESGVVAGWRWSASLSDRTCPACLSLSGQVFSLDTPMATHVSCRCAAVPWSPKWHEPWQTGDDWLMGQDTEVQETVLGAQGAADFRARNLRLRDFRQLTHDAKWGDSYQSRGVGYARTAAGKAGRAPEQWADAPERKTGQRSKVTDTTLTTISEKSADTGEFALPR